jgi:putative transferase (TIGR04331 family)
LGQLTGHLNKEHGLNADIRFWRTILGCWLLHFISMLLDGYMSFKDDMKYVCGRKQLLKRGMRLFIPYDFNDFFLMATISDADLFRAQLLAQIEAASLGKDLHKIGEISSCDKKTPIIDERKRNRDLKFACMKTLSKISLDIKPDIVFHGQILFLDILLLLAQKPLKIGFLIDRFPKEFKSTASISMRRRINLINLKAEDPFEEFVIRTLPLNLPALYLEGFSTAYRYIMRKIDKWRPKIFCTVGGLFSDEFGKFYAAEAYRRGTRIVTVQHGGFYGMGKSAPVEKYERDISDTFYSWGWGKLEKDKKVLDIPSIKLSKVRTRKLGDAAKKAGILVCGTAHPRYLYRFHSCPVGPQWNAYFEDTLRFIKCLSNDLRRKVVFRPYSLNNDYGWNVTGLYRKRLPDLVIDDHSLSFEKQIEKFRLVVLDHNATIILQTLAGNIPTVMYFDRNLWELRDYAVPFFDMLRSAKILFDDPEDAARHVDSVYDDVNSWWCSGLVRRNVKEFTKHFALSSRRWVKDWADILKQECVLAGTQ